MCDASPLWRGLELWAASIDVLRLRSDADSVIVIAIHNIAEIYAGPVW
jgi:hypothetical protein